MGTAANGRNLGLHWVGDLVLECSLEVEGSQGKFLMALVQGGRVFRCELDVATGVATLVVDGDRPFPTAHQTPVRGPGKYELRFANVDQQLVLWVNGHVIPFDPKPEYQPGANDPPIVSSVGPDPMPNEDDLRPARFGTDGLAATVRHVRLFRDVYYIAMRADPPHLARADVRL